MSYNSIIVSTSAKLIVSANPRRQSLIITNGIGNLTLFLGSDNLVTTSTGIEIPAGSNLTEDNGGSKVYCGDVWGIAQISMQIKYWERTEQ